MKNFILKIVSFLFFFFLTGEVLVRVFKLVSDIPHRYVDDYGIQKYKKGQEGFYKKYKAKWVVNDYGWLGVAETSKDTIISIIGDSYIENMMNPISCHQGSLLSSSFANFSFFEAGRSGMTFIETMEISKILDSELEPKLHLIYVSNNDFDESIANKRKYTDRVQIDLEKNTIYKSELKSPKLKKVLYSSKLFYYLYLKYLASRAKLSKKKVNRTNVLKEQKYEMYDALLNYSFKNYDLNKIVLVCHPDVNSQIRSILVKYKFHTVFLDDNNEDWSVDKKDSHWSCFGHRQVEKQVALYLPLLLDKTK